MLGISQFYILSPRGDTIISRDYRSDIVKGSGTAEIFFRKVKFWNDKNDRYSGKYLYAFSRSLNEI